MDEGLNLRRDDNTLENKEKLKKRILVADDDESTLYLLIEFISEFGYDVVAVKNGKELLDKLIDSKEKFDAILSDNNMPKMNGIDVLEQIRKNPEFKTIPFILQTGATDSKLDRRVKELDGRYLEKPSSFKDIRKILKEELEEKDE